jgi:hypothetical protein
VVDALKVIAEALRARRVESIFVRGGNHRRPNRSRDSWAPSTREFGLRARPEDVRRGREHGDAAVGGWRSSRGEQQRSMTSRSIRARAIVLDGRGRPGNVRNELVRIADAGERAPVFAGPRNADVTAPEGRAVGRRVLIAARAGRYRRSRRWMR